MSPESPLSSPASTSAAHGFSPAPDPKAVKPRLQRPKLLPRGEGRAEGRQAGRQGR